MWVPAQNKYNDSWLLKANPDSKINEYPEAIGP